MPTKVRPLISIRLYDQPQDPKPTDRGFTWLDVPALTAALGTWQLGTRGLPILEFLGDDQVSIGLTTRLVRVLSDTRLARYTTSGGTWQERRPATGAPRKYRLCQTDTTAGVVWSASSDFDLPDNSPIALSLILGDTPPDWDADTYPPYVRFELGGQVVGGIAGATWAIHLDKTGCYLLRDSNWVGEEIVMTLPAPVADQGFTDTEEMFIWVRCHRGRIGISTDDGRSYRWYGTAINESDPAAVGVPRGKVRFVGQGAQAVVGLHQLAPIALTGWWQPPPANTFTSRGLLDALLFTARADTPYATTIVWADRSTPTDGVALFRVTLTPKARPAVPFSVYACPVLYSTTARYPVVTSAAAGTYTTPWDTYLMSGTIDKPFELDEATCTFSVHLSPFTLFSTNLRRRKIVVRFGWLLSDNTEEWSTVFTGYCRKPSLRRSRFGEIILTVTADSTPQLMKTAEWTPLDVLALSDFGALNVAADFVLYTEGLTAAHRSWHAIGDVWILPQGIAEDPCELIRPREKKWETLARIFSYAGLELAAANDGTYLTLPVDYVDALVSHTYRSASPVSDRTEIIQGLTNSLDYGSHATAAIVTGTAPDGTAMLAWARDAEAEDDTGSDRYDPWRELRQEEVRGTTSPGLLAARTAALALEFFPLRSEADLEADLRPDASRREMVEVYGCEGEGIPDGSTFAVLTLRHEWAINPDQGEFTHRTAAGLVRMT